MYTDIHAYYNYIILIIIIIIMESCKVPILWLIALNEHSIIYIYIIYIVIEMSNISYKKF